MDWNMTHIHCIWTSITPTLEGRRHLEYAMIDLLTSLSTGASLLYSYAIATVLPCYASRVSFQDRLVF